MRMGLLYSVPCAKQATLTDVHYRPGLSTKVSGVPGGEIGPLFREIVQRENRRYRTHRDTRPAVDTLYRIDVNQLFGCKLGIVFLGMDAIHRTGVHACRVFGADAGFSYYVSHTGVKSKLSGEQGTTFIPQPGAPVQFPGRERADLTCYLSPGATNFIVPPTILVGTGRFELPTCRLGGDRTP